MGMCNDFLQGRCSRGAACKFSHGAAAPSLPPQQQQQQQQSSTDVAMFRGGGGGGGALNSMKMETDKVCSECTFINTSLALACSMCGSTKLNLNLLTSSSSPSFVDDDEKSGENEEENEDDERLDLNGLEKRYPNHSTTVHKALLALDHNAIDYELVCQVGWFVGLVCQVGWFVGFVYQVGWFVGFVCQVDLFVGFIWQLL
jgi:hypothetical protein